MNVCMVVFIVLEFNYIIIQFYNVCSTNERCFHRNLILINNIHIHPISMFFLTLFFFLSIYIRDCFHVATIKHLKLSNAMLTGSQTSIKYIILFKVRKKKSAPKSTYFYFLCVLNPKI